MVKTIKKIEKENIEDIIALTPMQEGLLYHYIKDDDSNQYFQQLSIKITGKLDAENFDKSWNIVVQLNELLRTVYRWEGVETHLQIVLREHAPDIRFVDFSTKDENLIPSLMENLKRADKNEHFDLREVPFRVTLCKLSENAHEMIISNHHIIFDGWSTGILLKEFTSIYEGLIEGSTYIPPQKNKFKNFVKWVQNQDSAISNTYWRTYLKELSTKTQLAVNKNLKSGTRSIKDYIFNIDKTKLDIFLRENKITLATLVYVTWGILLQKYVDHEDVLFGVTVSGRSANIADIENIVGLFINTVPLRIKNSSEDEILNLLYQVQNEIQQREGYDNTPIVDIKECSEFHNQDELFDSIVVVENYPLDTQQFGIKEKLTFDSYSMHEVNNFNLTVGVELWQEQIEICLSYDEEIFNYDFIKRLAQHFENILQTIIHTPHSKVRDIEMLSPLEKKQILYEFNNTTMDYPKDKTIHKLFEEQVEQGPNHVALVFVNKHITYTELNEKANQLARFLVNTGIKRNDVIGIMAERSVEMIISILATLKAGAAYLPIGLEQPKKRKEYMIQNSGASLLLTQKHLIEVNNNVVGDFPEEKIICSDDMKIYVGDRSNLNLNSNPDDLVNVIYTSGTTGNPKGVMVSHSNLVLYMESLFNLYETTSNDTVIQLVPFSFDLFGEELFQALLKGGKFVIPQEHEAKDVHKLYELIVSNKVSVVSCSPLLLNEFNKFPPMSSVKNFVSGGDVLKQEYISNLLKYANVYNGYGPTEATIGATHYKIKNEFENNICIGKPMKNYRVYILDENRNLLPIGVPGELYISGKGVTKGYINNRKITEEKFVEDYFFPGSKMYRTGDLAKWRNDGNVEYLSRIDQQIKIRGFRIEPSEIENQLRQYNSIREATVIANEDKQGNKYLCAFIISNIEVEPRNLKAFLLKTLPEYMVPVQFIQLEEIPATTNGKIDKNKLSEMSLAKYENRTKIVEPRDDMEKDILEVWKNVLKRDEISIEDDFFEIGGDSLKLTSIYSILNKKFSCNISIQDLFDYRTIDTLAKLVKERLGYLEDKNEINNIEF
ncbi:MULTISPECIES: non-ribosomal peptide synthetase [Paenibacillus]|uniref:non-ribosomal peptide synthetase n=1 Tax=Paenibacillus TaxID=44249 RepID=UPI0013E8F861|nr:non-ribosomal peptide synthetase [Paenibacillus sp. EKM211P]KAF6582685.1 amino acid adenylation domain-containing protein [Paenibacillus sp. EKM211P]MEE4562231.1 non-ribosomal peptide synthetase [Paenibacillus polymyxa]